jgi:isopentenyl-diphosphate delta-isomerase type 1
MAKLVKVNKKDEFLGLETKEKCHEGRGILHRAFSIFIFNNKNQLLLQKRSKFKLLWPLYWSNSCCSHPQKVENIKEAAQKRLKEELGFICQLQLIGSFQYQAQYKNIGSENELSSVLIGEYDEKVIPNLKEVASLKWIGLEKLQKDIKKNPRKYTPWLKIGLGKVLEFKVKQAQKKEKLNLALDRFSKIVDPTIKRILTTFVDKKFQQIVKYPVSTGGKRLRPALAIMSCLMLGGKLKDILYPAAGLEILHNYTLIADDIIDNSNLRRGKPTCWFKFGDSIAQCIEIAYGAAIFQAAVKSKKPVLISELFAKAIKSVADGEILDILFERGGREKERYVVKNRYRRIKERDYFEMISKKTAFLLQTSCQVGGIVAGAKEKELEALRKYGFNLGLVFQITDDILDIFGKEKEFKKKIGKDIEERKEGNIVILLALKELSPVDKKKFLKIMRKDKIDKKDIKEAMELIKKTNSQEKAHQLGKQFSQKAQNALKPLPKNKWNNILRGLADFILERKN